MTAFQCELCKKVFGLKTDLERHKNKKAPCVSKEKIIEIYENNAPEKSKEDDRKKIEKFLTRAHDILRDKEGIVTMDALNHINMLLFLRLVNTHVKDKIIDLLDIEKYRPNMLDTKKKYIQFALFDNIIDNGKFTDNARNNLSEIIENIFKQILWFHPKTKIIFADKCPRIKHESTYEIILREISKIDWDLIDSDIKGMAYEHFLNTELAGGELGQFFTRREVCDYMINNVEFTIDKKIMDPFMGTCGFLTRSFKKMKKLYVEKNKVITNEVIDNMLHGIEKNESTSIIGINNCLITTGFFPSDVRLGDSLRNYMKEKVDIVLTNPPFGIKGMSYDDDSLFPSNYNGIKKSEYLPIKSNDAICLAIQMIYYTLSEKGQCAIIIPNGKQLNGKNKSEMGVRKLIIDNCNLKKVTFLPSGTFLPYTGVETAILFFNKGEKTKTTKFIMLDEDYKTEKELVEVKYEDLQKNNYVLNYKKYVKENKLENSGTLKYYLVNELLIFLDKSKRKASDGKTEGMYNFYTAGKYIYKSNFVDYTDDCIIFSTGGNASVKYDKYFSCSADNFIAKISNDKNILKYIYYYLQINVDKLNNLFNGTTIKHLSKNDLYNLQIPVPPISVQNKIVQELDALYSQKENAQKYLDNMSQRKKGEFITLFNLCEDVKNEKLENICEINIGGTPSRNRKEYFTGNELWLQISDMTQKYIENTKEKITNDAIKNSSVKKISIGDILLSFKLSIGKVSIAKKEMYCNEAIAFFHGNEKIQTDFLYYYFYVTDISSQKSGCIGTGSLNKENLKNLQIPIPSLSDQKKIVEHMEKYDTIEKLLREDLDNLDKLIKTRFDYYIDSCKEATDKKEDNSSESEEKKSKNKKQSTESSDEAPRIKKKVSKKQSSESSSDEVPKTKKKQSSESSSDEAPRIKKKVSKK